MSQDFTHAVDELQLAEWIADGWTHLSLWYSRYPEGPFTNASVTWSPTTLALMSSGADYTATCTFSGADPSYHYKIRLYNGSAYSDLSQSETFHGGGGYRLRELREIIGKEIRELRTGTATTSTSSSNVVIATPNIQRAPSNYYTGWILNNITRGTWSVVATSTRNSSDHTVTVSPTIASQTSGDEIELIRRFTPDEFKDAINWALTTSYPLIGRSSDYRGIYTVLNQHEYDLPDNIRNVRKVEIESLNNSDSTDNGIKGYPWREIPFSEIREGISTKLVVGDVYLPVRRMRITYFSPLDPLYNDTDYVPLYGEQVNYIKYLAIHKLYDGLVNDASAADRAFLKERSMDYWGKAEKLAPRIRSRRPAKSLWQQAQRNHLGTTIKWGSYNTGVGLAI